MIKVLSSQKFISGSLTWILLVYGFIFVNPGTELVPLIGLTVFGLCLFAFALANPIALTDILLFSLAALVSVLYFDVTPSNVRQHDVQGHIEYVRLLEQNGTLPLMSQGWETYHPPSYYLAVASWEKIYESLAGVKPNNRNLQALSLLIYLATLLLAAIVWTSLKVREPLHWLGIFAFAFIPSHLFFSARINNDVLMPFWGIAAFVGVLAYWERPRNTVAFGIGLITAMALSTKLNGIALWITGAICILLGPSFRPPQALRQLRFFSLFLVTAPGLGFLMSWMLRSWLEEGALFYDNTRGLPIDMLVPNSAYKFLYFDLSSYLSQTRADPFGGSMRKSFPTFLVSTFLTSDAFYSPSWTFLITVLRSVLILLLGCLIFGLTSVPRLWEKSIFRLASIFFGMQFAFLVALNLRSPFSCSMDARYLAPGFFPLAILIGFGVQASVQYGGWPKRLALSTMVVFPPLLLIFYFRIFVGF